MKTILMLVCSCMLLVGCNESQRGNGSNLNEDRNEAAAGSDTKEKRDADFVYEVVESNYSEIKFAGLANQRSRNTEVKRIAQMLLTDHTASLNDLKTVAQAKAISVPVEETEAARRDLEKMAAEADADFDRAWCSRMMDIHDKTIEKFEKRLEDSGDAELKAYIEKTLPVLKRHHEALKVCDEKLQRPNR